MQTSSCVPRWNLLVVVEDLEQTPEGGPRWDRHWPGPMATDREINCPSAGKSVSAYREIGMSASKLYTVHIEDGDDYTSLYIDWRPGESAQLCRNLPRE